jgi:hypothetical protein
MSSIEFEKLVLKSLRIGEKQLMSSETRCVLHLSRNSSSIMFIKFVPYIIKLLVGCTDKQQTHVGSDMYIRSLYGLYSNSCYHKTSHYDFVRILPITFLPVEKTCLWPRTLHIDPHKQNELIIFSIQWRPQRSRRKGLLLIFYTFHNIAGSVCLLYVKEALNV